MMVRNFWLGVACLLGLCGSALAQDSRPNIVLILADDVALMDFGVYGGEANTPNIDALAARGTLFKQHRATPFCAPSRAMLLTGLDNHTAGLGTIREVLPPEFKGKPGYTMRLEPGVVTLAERLKRGGYRTYMTGKWHLGHEDGDLPIDHGFDQSFLVDASGADNWENQSYIPYYRDVPWFEGREPVDLPEDFYSSTFFVDQMIDYLDADSDKDEPFLAYVAFLAVHIPVQAPREYTEKYLDTYSVGWEATRQARWERAQALGLVREGAPLSTPSPTLKKWSWENLTEEEKAFATGNMAVNAGMLEAMDHEIGRLIDYLKETGQYDNTVFIVTSDNGPEAGDPINSPAESWLKRQGYTWDLETLGEKGSYVAIGPEWAQAASGPSNLFKFHAGDGGLRVPLIMAGPGIPADERIDAFTVMSDIAPTLVDMAGVDPDHPEAITMHGRSLAPLLSGASQEIYAPTDAVGFETSGQSALFKGDYKLVRSVPPHGDGIWRLHNIATDPGEAIDLSADMPDLKEELMADYRTYADRVGVLELPEGYDAHREIMNNVYRRMFGWYWPYLLGGLIGVLVALYGAYRLVRWGLGKRT